MRIPEVNGLCVLYERLSRDDDSQGDSNSIVNQKRLLERYAADHGFTNTQHYTDDGYSGANFERPAWKKLIKDRKRRADSRERCKRYRERQRAKKNADTVA